MKPADTERVEERYVSYNKVSADSISYQSSVDEYYVIPENKTGTNKSGEATPHGTIFANPLAHKDNGDSEQIYQSIEDSVSLSSSVSSNSENSPFIQIGKYEKQ